jgi:hypothetical protein
VGEDDRVIVDIDDFCARPYALGDFVGIAR